MEQILGKITTLLPEDKEESPQPNTSEYSLQEVVDDEVSGPSAPGVDPSPSCRSLCWKRKREWSDQSEEEPEKEPEKELSPEPEETWVVETLCGLKMKLKRRRVSPVLPEHHEAFNRLLGRRTPQRAPPILFFLKRGNFQYYLANDMEEDTETPKQNIIYFLYRKNRSQIPWFRKPLFHKLRFQFFRSMRFRAWVSLEELEEIQAYDPEHWVWARDRATFLRAPGTMKA
ncbi:PREDICTED: putative speedy protein-like protein 2 [Mandrillus leucophaeus]|uniref:putative speedy protein-like protein 2 n=1 Tax=Mandrillus leucophaeus TaxID=9568 RepID=UPI0005F41260|nr:PREDICTED: putative speedy protein-like protein 2 [Mandrillus leucophaeus]